MLDRDHVIEILKKKGLRRRPDRETQRGIEEDLTTEAGESLQFERGRQKTW
jgi:hypothetical protein